MKTSEKTGELVKALLNSQKEFPAITKDKTAKVPTKSGGQYTYTYADLTSILDAVRPVLLKNGLVLQHGAEANGHNVINCRLSHTSGEWQESALNLPDGIEAQSMGSAVTYYRRYTACAMLGISTEDDDDGAQATGHATQHNASKPAAAAKPSVYKLADKQPTPAPADEAGERVPLEVTAGSAPEGNAADGLTLCTLEAYSKPKTDKGGKSYRGVLLGPDDWWNVYDSETINKLQSMKGKQVYAKLETKGTFKLCHNLTEVGNG